MRAIVVLVVIGGVVASACGTDDAETTTTAPPSTAESGSVVGDDRPELPASTPTTEVASPDEAPPGDDPASSTTTEPATDPTTDSGAADDLDPGAADELDPLAEDGRDHVVRYLDHLAAGRFAEAAVMLGEGGLDWAQRWDLHVLGEITESEEWLASVLEDWCDIARCEAPTEVTARVDDGGRGATVTATWRAAGATASATFLGGSWEGAPSVQGLPPVSGEAALSVVADVVGTATVVAELPDSGVVAWIDGDLFELAVPDDAFPWSDGEFVFWRVRGTEADPGSAVVTSFAMTLDGRVVCEAPGRIHQLRETAEGTFVASVEGEERNPLRAEEWAIPNVAVQCETGEETPIAPVSYRREGGGRATEVIAGRTFSFTFDAEGNGDVLNEREVSINGGDDAGFHTFSPDAGVVVYGDYGVSISPHTTDTIRARDTEDGAALWSADLDRSFGSLFVTETHVVVGLPPEAQQFEPWFATESLALLDLGSGERLATIPTDLHLIQLS